MFDFLSVSGVFVPLVMDFLSVSGVFVPLVFDFLSVSGVFVPLVMDFLSVSGVFVPCVFASLGVFVPPVFAILWSTCVDLCSILVDNLFSFFSCSFSGACASICVDSSVFSVSVLSTNCILFIKL